MLSPDTRTVAMDLLKPPPGSRLDIAVLTTYSLNLETLLALPLAVLAHAEGGLNELLKDPLPLHGALQEAGERVHVFVDEGAIAVPQLERPLYAMLESSVHPVRAPNQGVFHPKVWFARFLNASDKPLLRIAVLSRNLTFDRSWDVALVSEAHPKTGRQKVRNRALGELLRALPNLSIQPVSREIRAKVRNLAAEVERARFPAPEDFKGEITFQTLGLSKSPRHRWQPPAEGSRILAIAPFVSSFGLKALSGIPAKEKILVSRQDALDALQEDTLASWESRAFSDDAVDESEGETANPLSGLHAKMLCIEHGRNVRWFVGSVNLTRSAFEGRNVEVWASLQGQARTLGIDPFLQNGFGKLCATYARAESEPLREEIVAAQRKLEQACRILADDDALQILCARDGNSWNWTLQGKFALPDGIEGVAWPISIQENQAQPLAPQMRWHLPPARLTAFVAFRLKATEVKNVEDAKFTLKLPARGLPEDRLTHVLRTLIDSPERFLRFLRALLGGLDSLVDWARDEDKTSGEFSWRLGFRSERLLENLMQVASRDPERLETVNKLIQNLRTAEDQEKQVIPDDFYALWAVIEHTLKESKTDAAS